MECENGHKNHKDIYYGHILSNHNVDTVLALFLPPFYFCPPHLGPENYFL